MKNSVKRIAVFASGSGSNAENLVRYFSGSDRAKIELILTNNSSAGVIARAKNLDVPCTVFSRKELHETEFVLNLLRDKKIDCIVLAGFLLLLPENILHAFEKKIINIHPALLPGFGGKGWYGDRVQQAVLESRNIMSGITIHFVNDRFDEGEIIFQAACHVSREDTAVSLAEKIHALEYSYFPVVVEKILDNV